MNYTLVLGLDRKHLQQLAWVWPTWQQHKPSTCRQTIVVFYDHEQICANDIKDVIGNKFTAVPWPPPGVEYRGGNGKWDNPQRMKMLSGFVHVAAQYVETKYWLKLDTDVVARGHDDWVDPAWFGDDPAIVAQPWHYTKPKYQMLGFDVWVERNCESLYDLYSRQPLNLSPKPGQNKVKHSRICSWCGFFHTGFTQACAHYARETCGIGQLPQPSQDGYQWYVAQRLGLPIVRVDMRTRGWAYKSTMGNVRRLAEEAMACPAR